MINTDGHRAYALYFVGTQKGFETAQFDIERHLELSHCPGRAINLIHEMVSSGLFTKRQEEGPIGRCFYALTELGKEEIRTGNLKEVLDQVRIRPTLSRLIDRYIEKAEINLKIKSKN